MKRCLEKAALSEALINLGPPSAWKGASFFLSFFPGKHCQTMRNFREMPTNQDRALPEACHYTKNCSQGYCAHQLENAVRAFLDISSKTNSKNVFAKTNFTERQSGSNVRRSRTRKRGERAILRHVLFEWRVTFSGGQCSSKWRSSSVLHKQNT